MVGAPKHLHELNKLQADVRVTCRKCKFEMDWTVRDLSAHLIAIGGNLTWSEITRLLVCQRQGCGSTSLRAAPVAYARRQANLPRRIRRIDARLIEVSLEVLASASSHPSGTNVATREVRLALLVVYVFTRDGDLVRRFWSRAGDVHRSVSEGLGELLAMIRHRLMEEGWLAEAASPHRTPTWPWDTPAPPGWYERPVPDQVAPPDPAGHVPVGIDPAAWRMADTRGKRRLIRSARG